MTCPLCRADIEIDIARRPPIIPVPDQTPARVLELIGAFTHKPRLTESVVKAIAHFRSQGIHRIAVLPDSAELKEDIEQALEFVMAMFVMRRIGNIQELFESGFGATMPDLSGFLCFGDYILLPKCQKFLYVAGQGGINTLDTKNIEGFVVFSSRELERVVGMTTNRLFGEPRDISNRIVYIRKVFENGKVYEVESGV